MANRDWQSFWRGGNASDSEPTPAQNWKAFWSGAGSTAEQGLNRAVESANDSGDSGLMGFARKIADKTGLDSAANVVMKGLEVADLGRSFVLAAGTEGMDALSALTGGEGATQNTDRVQQTGVSFDDLIENTKRHIGMGDLLEADPRTKNLPLNVKRALGFVGDVAADPLTYVTGGATAVGRGAEAADVGRRTLVSNQDVAARLLKAGDEAGAEAVAAGRSAAAVPRAATEAVGIDRGIYVGNRWRITPLDGVYDSFSRGRGAARRAVAETIVSRVTPERWVKFERVPGTALIRHNPELVRQGTANVKALEWTIGWRDARNAARTMKAGYGTRLNELFTQFGQGDKDALRRAIEAGDMSAPGAAEMKSFFDDIIKDVNELTGSTIPTLDNYLSHILTPEAREGLGKASAGGGLPGFARKRNLDKTIDEANAAFKDFMNDADEALRRKFGPTLPEYFKTDPFEIAAEYLNSVERFVRMRSFERSMRDAGLLTYFNKPGVRKAMKANRAHLKEATRLGRKAALAESKRAKAAGQAAAVASDMTASPFEAPSAVRATEKGADAILAGVDAEDLGRASDDISATLDELAAEGAGLRAKLDEAVDEDPLEAISRTQGAIGRHEANLAAAQEARQAAQSELDDLSATQAAAAAPAPAQGSLTELQDQAADAKREVDRLKAQKRRGGTGAAKPPKAEPMTVGERKVQALAHLKSIGAPPKAMAEARSQFETDLKDTLLKDIEKRFKLPTEKVPEGAAVPAPAVDLDTQIEAAVAQHKSLKDAIKELKQAVPAAEPPPADLAERITAAKRQVAAAGGREAKATKAIERHLATIDEHQAILETEYAVKGDVQPLIEQNDARVAELTREQRRVTKAKAKAEARELALRRKADELYAKAANETDPRMAQHARFEAQARQAEAETYKHRWGQVAEWSAVKVVNPKDKQLLELASAGAIEQIASINRFSQLWADPETAKAFLSLKESLKPEKIGALLRLHDSVMSRWKAYSLLSGGYHFRNGYSAMFMNQVAGYRLGPDGYITVERAMRTALKEGNIEAGLKLAKPKYHEALRELWEMRGPMFDESGLGQGFADVYQQSGRRRGILPGSGKFDPTSLDNVALKANTRAASWVERNVRGALFIDSIMAGLTRDEAYERVIRFHFDYSEGISQFEKRVMRRVVPFYTWARLNFPLQLEYMARNPKAYVAYTHAKRNLELGTEEDKYVPSYLGELGAIRLPVTRGGDNMYVAPDLPFLRLGQTFDTDQLAAQVTPLIKTPLELDKGQRYFNDIPFKAGPQKVPASWVGMGELLSMAGGRFGLPKVEKIDGDYFFTDEAQMYKVEQAMPLLGRMRRLAPSDKAGQERALSSWLSFGLGVTTQVNSPTQQANEMRRREHEINDLVRAWERRQEASAQ